MFAPQNQQPNVIDALSGSMEEWYEAVDDAVKKSDVIPGNYEMLERLLKILQHISTLHVIDSKSFHWITVS